MTFAYPPPERVVIVGRHLDNQFQVPILFLIACCAHMVVDQVNTLTLVLAWAFIAARWGHSFVHLGSNQVLTRAKVFAMGWLMVGVLWIQLAYFAYNLI